VKVISQKKVAQSILLRLTPSLSSKRKIVEDFPRIVTLINWENMGDFVLFTPIIREIRMNFPNSKLIVLAQRENKELVENCPYVDQWIWIKGHRKPKLGMAHGIQTTYLRKFLDTYFLLLIHGRKRIDLLFGPDWLLVESTSQFYNNLLFKKGNPRLKYLVSTADRNRANFLDESHQVTRMLSVLKMFDLRVSSDELENWITPVISDLGTPLLKSGVARPKRILISLGAGQKRRNWPVESYKQLILGLIVRYPDCLIDVLGPKSLLTSENVQAFPDSKNVRNLIGKMNLSQIVNLMNSSDLIVSNDSGLAHVAASMKLACVVVSAHPLNGDPWHLHSPKRYHPWKTRFRVIQPLTSLDGCLRSCSSQESHCIRSISPTQVQEACEDLLTEDTVGIKA
jgi:ADP-heptose:LPS heptosyltransferase